MGIITSEITGQTTGEAAGEATVWLSYHDLADRLGIKPASAKRRAVDRKWPKKIGNDGRSLVAVPREIIEGAAREATGEISGEGADDIPSDGNALLDLLKGELEGARRELRTVRAEAVEARDRAVKAEAEAELHGLAVADLREELQARTAELEARRTEAVEARERAARAEGELAGLRQAMEAELAYRTAGRPWARAWRGLFWRGRS